MPLMFFQYLMKGGFVPAWSDGKKLLPAVKSLIAALYEQALLNPLGEFMS